MIIKSLELSSFGKFNDYKLDLKEGINLIYGENESGKSTLHSFINGIFYGFLKPFTKKTIYLKEHENYNPLNFNEYRGNLEFEIDNILYRIERDFKKGNENTRIYEKTTGENITSRVSDLSLGKVIQPGIYFFDLSDMVFKNTVFISQQGIPTDDKLADEIRDRLINVATTKDENISVYKAIDILDKEIKDIGTERAYTSNYGVLFLDLNNKKMQLKQVQDTRNTYNQWLTKAEGINEKRKTFKIKVLEEKEKLDHIKANDKFKIYKEALKYQKDINLLKREMLDIEVFQGIDLDTFKKAEYLEYDIINLLSQIENLKSDLDILEYEKENLDVSNDEKTNELEAIIEDGFRIEYIQEKIAQGSLANKKEGRASRISLIFLSALYLILVFYSLNIKNYQLLLGLQPILAAFIILLFKLKSSKKAISKNQNLNNELIAIIGKYDLLSITEFHSKLDYAKNKKVETQNKNKDLIKLNDRIEIAKNNLYNLEKKLKDYRNDLDEILLINKQKNMIDFKIGISKKLRLDEIRKELENCHTNLSRILNGKTIEEIRVDKKEVIDSEMDLQNLDEEKILDKLKVLNDNLELLNLDYREAEVQVNNLEDQISKEALLKEDILNLEFKISKLNNKKTSLTYAIDRIRELSTDIHRDYAPIINNKVGHMVNKITGGKYKSVKIDKDLKVSLESSDGNRVLDFNKLSAGTIDQIYFSLRMGLTEEVVSKNLPLVFDECFSQYDDNRLQSILEFLAEKEEKRQIIIFTCHKREKIILDNLGIEYNYISL